MKNLINLILLCGSISLYAGIGVVNPYDFSGITRKEDAADSLIREVLVVDIRKYYTECLEKNSLLKGNATFIVKITRAGNIVIEDVIESTISDNQFEFGVAKILETVRLPPAKNEIRYKLPIYFSPPERR